MRGEVVHIDAFGNLCTNIRKQDIEDFALGRAIVIEAPGNLRIQLADRYDIKEKGMALAVYDSHDSLEIAVNQGNAAQQLQLTMGDKIILSCKRTTR